MSHKFFIAILLPVMYLVPSCSRDKYKPPDTSSNNVSATISIGSNASFQFSSTGAATRIYPLALSASTYRIEATDASSNNLVIVVENVIQKGTYPFTSNDGIAGSGLTFVKNGIGLIAQHTYRTSDPAITDKGSVTVTVLDNHHIEGRFSALCERQDPGEVAMINGSFKGSF